jgi:hypothetical protein
VSRHGLGTFQVRSQDLGYTRRRRRRPPHNVCPGRNQDSILDISTTVVCPPAPIRGLLTPIMVDIYPYREWYKYTHKWNYTKGSGEVYLEEPGGGTSTPINGTTQRVPDEFTWKSRGGCIALAWIRARGHSPSLGSHRITAPHTRGGHRIALGCDCSRSIHHARLLLLRSLESPGRPVPAAQGAI